MPASQARTKRWTRLEYERLIDLGAFGPEDRLELIAGQLVVRDPRADAIRPAFVSSRAPFARRSDPTGTSRPNCRSRSTRSPSQNPM
jgi:hypothetical protein